MPNIFEELMNQNRQLTENLKRDVPATKKSVKISPKKLKVESLRFLEDIEDYDEVDAQFSVDPEESKEDEVVLVIDPELSPEEEVPEDAAESLVGDYVYKCPVCGSNYVCACDAAETEALEVDENGVPVECPVCGDDAEQILVGEIAPAEGAGEETEMEPQEVDDEESEEDTVEGEGEEEFIDEEEDKDEVIEDSLKRRPALRFTRTESKKKSKACPECGKNPCECKKVNESAGEDQKWVDYDEKHYGKISKATEKAIKDDGDEIIDGDFEGHDDKEVVAKEAAPVHRRRKVREAKKTVKEDVDFCEDGECEDEFNEEEFVEEEPELKFEEKDETKAAVNIDAEVVNIELDDKRFESLMTKMVRENYQNDPQFKLTRAVASKGKLTLEYFVKDTKKKSVIKGTLIAEGLDLKSRRFSLKVRDKGAFTESVTKAPSFVIECVRVRNKIIPTSIKYNFTKKVNESLYRIKGEVKTSK